METTQVKKDETFKITGNWSEQSKQMKSKFPQLTDSDLKFEPGKESELLSRLETKLEKSHEEVIDIIKNGQTEKSPLAV